MMRFAVVVAVALSLSFAWADDLKWYIGVEGGKSFSSTTAKQDGGTITDPIDGTNDNSDLKIVLGKGVGDYAYAQFYYSSIKYKDALFFAKKKRVSEVGFEGIKEVGLSDWYYPFLKLGVGMAYAKVNDDVQNIKGDIRALSVTVGMGADLKLNSHLSLIVGADYNYKSWENVKYNDGSMFADESVDTSTKAAKVYGGVNVRF